MEQESSRREFAHTKDLPGVGIVYSIYNQMYLSTTAAEVIVGQCNILHKAEMDIIMYD